MNLNWHEHAWMPLALMYTIIGYSTTLIILTIASFILYRKVLSKGERFGVFAHAGAVAASHVLLLTEGAAAAVWDLTHNDPLHAQFPFAIRLCLYLPALVLSSMGMSQLINRGWNKYKLKYNHKVHAH